MRALIIDDKDRQRAEEIKEYAEKHRFNQNDVLDLMAGSLSPAGNRKECRMFIAEGFKVVYSQEEQPWGWSHHLSVSVDREDRYPTPEAVEMIAELFGMPVVLREASEFDKYTHVWVDKPSQAINVITKIT